MGNMGITFETAICVSYIPSVNRSPIHLAQVNVTMSGRANDILPVASIKMAVKLIVIRITPPN